MDLRKYIYSHCVAPVRVNIWDAYSSSYVVREMPCGKCLHCTNTHVNQWVTRLIAQRKYSKYCYYVSLDYAPFDEASAVAMQLAKETAAVYHDINKNKTYGFQPLVLCKNHLQDFYKRLRKNTNIKLQYFACGEYGTHADGHGYGRPHFHNIIFTNSPISPEQFESAWTIDGYKIGRVDFKDMTPLALGDLDSTKIFRYVCKYLQKTDFNFEKLATIDFHRAYFKSLQYVVKDAESLFPELVPIEDRTTLELAWRDYIKLYSPFIVCSKRPSIGAAYLEENLERFKKQDFRLFGLPQECVAFPRYYVRRAKESVFDFRAIGSVSEKPSTGSRMGYILQVLTFLQTTRTDISNWCENAPYSWCIYRDEQKDGKLCVKCDALPESILCRDLSFYDAKNKFMYQFTGYDYNVWAKIGNTYALFDKFDILDVLREVYPSWARYHREYLTPNHERYVMTENDLHNTIECLYKPTNDKSSYQLFMDEVYAKYQEELYTLYKTNLLRQNSKQTL